MGAVHQLLRTRQPTSCGHKHGLLVVIRARIRRCIRTALFCGSVGGIRSRLFRSRAWLGEYAEQTANGDCGPWLVQVPEIQYTGHTHQQTDGRGDSRRTSA